MQEVVVHIVTGATALAGYMRGERTKTVYDSGEPITRPGDGWVLKEVFQESRHVHSVYAYVVIWVKSPSQLFFK